MNNLEAVHVPFWDFRVFTDLIVVTFAADLREAVTRNGEETWLIKETKYVGHMAGLLLSAHLNRLQSIPGT